MNKFLFLLLTPTICFAQAPAESLDEIRKRFEANRIDAPRIVRDEYYQSIVIHILEDETLSQELEEIVMDDFQKTLGREDVDEINIIFLPANPNTGIVGWIYRRACPTADTMLALHMVCKKVNPNNNEWIL